MDSNSQSLEGSVRPYPGLASFGDSEPNRKLFFGRDKESQALLETVLAENLVLLFARSGVGKTSLINAGVLEPLRTRGFFPVVVRLTHDANRGPIQSVYECVTEQASRDKVTVSDESSTESLWEYFYTTRFVRDGKLLRPVLVLDQFEELFTIIGPQKSRRESFIKELADLARQRVPEPVRKRETGKLENLEESDEPDPERQRIISLLYEGAGPEVKIVISIREDFLAEIEGLKSELPTIFRNSFRLEPLSIDEARKAIEQPTQQEELLGNNRFTFAPGVVDRMLDFLRIQKVAGKFVRANSIEPVQLQILCQHFYRQSLRKRQRQPSSMGPAQATGGPPIPEISLTDLGGRNGMKRAMVGYYHRVLKQFPRFRLGWSTRGYRPSFCNFLFINRARAAIRTLAENKLVTPGGYRNSISADVIQRGVGVPEEDLAKLVDERLLRTEPRLGGHFYELTHDTMLRPLVKARKKRQAYWASALLVFPLFLFALPSVVGLVNISRILEMRPLKRRVSNLNEAPDQRIASFKVLLTSPRYRDCSRCDLTAGSGRPQMDLHDFKAYGVDLSRSVLNGANFNGAVFPASDFSQAKLIKVNFSKGSLYRSDFIDADLSGSNLTEANLSEADFTRANLKGAILTGALLENADLTNAQIEPSIFLKDGKAGNTVEVVWWTAMWRSSKLLELSATCPYQKFKDGETYKADIKKLDYVDNYQDEESYDSKDRPLVAGLFNNRAWFRAIRGVEPDKAEEDARRARRLDPTSDRAMDTLGYILLEKGRYDEAMSEFQQSLAARQQGASDPVRLGLAYYHLGLAFDRKGDRQQMQNYFAKANELAYRPTYECVLTPPSDMSSCDWPNPRKNVR
jgi:tetratricopeptide (TPR) repeat protein